MDLGERGGETAVRGLGNRKTARFSAGVRCTITMKRVESGIEDSGENQIIKIETVLLWVRKHGGGGMTGRSVPEDAATGTIGSSRKKGECSKRNRQTSTKT